VWADFVGSDNFSGTSPNTTNWTVNGYQENPTDVLTQGSGVLTYLVPTLYSGSGNNSGAAWLWNFNAPSTSDWSATLDVTNLSTVNSSYSNIGLIARNASDLFNYGFSSRLDKASSGAGTVINWEADLDQNPSTTLYQAFTTSTSGSVFLSYSSATQTLTAGYDPDGATNGYTWFGYASTTLSALNMTTADSFVLGINGSSYNQTLSGLDGVTADNFNLTSSAALFTVVPEPSEWILFGLGFLAMMGQLRLRPARIR
jgi:hypothetical protein